MFLRAKPIIESLYEDTCTIYKVTQGKGTKGQTVTTWAAVCEDIPCRLSFSSLAANTKDETADTINQSAKLFVGPDVDVPAGCRIEVTRSTGDVSRWERSGEPAVYSTHKEIVLAPLEVYA